MPSRVVSAYPALLIAPLVTFLIQLYGTRLVLNMGVFFGNLSLLAPLSRHKNGTSSSAKAVGIAPQWFQKRRSVAMGITAAGSGLGGLMYSLAVEQLFHATGCKAFPGSRHRILCGESRVREFASRSQ
ncbi:MFS transporter [Penicillium verhagenii]|nr:MFS transporter [Penicillium verhagenii]